MVNLITILFIIFAWHCFIISQIGYKLNTETFDSSTEFFPDHPFLKDLSRFSIGKVCNINPFTNQITLCAIGSSLCISKVVPYNMIFIDPYNLIKPLTINLCL